MKKVCVIGLGCIGLPTACILSDRGFKVVGVDTNQKLEENGRKSKKRKESSKRTNYPNTGKDIPE